jgi:hypothetical protein
MRNLAVLIFAVAIVFVLDFVAFNGFLWEQTRTQIERQIQSQETNLEQWKVSLDFSKPAKHR